MKLHILNDIHVEFQPFDPPPTDADVIILAGDIHVGQKGISWAKEKFKNVPILYVLGNHEYYGQIFPNHLTKLKQIAKDSNVQVLENDKVVIEDTVFLACTLWTDFKLYHNQPLAEVHADMSMNDFQQIRISPKMGRLRPHDTVKAHEQSLAWLKKQLKQHQKDKVVVITHHAPSFNSVHEKYKNDLLSAAFASNLDELIQAYQPVVWIHGHVHQVWDYTIGKTRILCNPRGYPGEGISDFNPGLVVKI